MIIIKQYGITLRSITESDLETIRNWRNSNTVIKNMFFQENISEKEQQKWYKNLDKKHNLYFIYNEQGVIHLKSIDWLKKEAEAGIFTIYQEAYSINIGAILTIMDFAFDVLSLNRLIAKVKKDALKNISMNLQLGYKVSSDENNCVTMICQKSDYKIEPTIRKWLKKNCEKDSELAVEISQESEWLRNYIQPSYLR